MCPARTPEPTRPVYPFQPLSFLRWLGAQVELPGLRCRAMFGADGGLSLRYASAGATASLRWLPPGAFDAPRFSVEGIQGVFDVQGLDSAQTAMVLDRLRALVARVDPHHLRWLPAEPRLRFTVASLGERLRGILDPGRTRWGPYRLEGLRQVSATALRYIVVRDPRHGGGSLAVRLEVVRWHKDEEGRLVSGREDLRFFVERDCRRPEERRSVRHQVERLFGFAVVRGLALQPEIQLALPSLAELLQRGASGAGAGGNIFFRVRGQNLISRELARAGEVSGSATVILGGRECVAAVPQVGASAERSGFLPWRTLGGQNRAVLFTDFDADAPPADSEAVALHALRRARVAAGPSGVRLLQLCDAKCASDDPDELRALVETALGTTPCEIARAYGRIRDPAHSANLWVSIFAEARSAPPPRAPRAPGPPRPTLNLVGLGPPEEPALVELRRLLEAAGAEVLACIFPFAGLARTPGAMEAQLWVTTPWQQVQRGPAAALDGEGLPMLCLPSPMGLRGTLAWVSAILAALDLPPLPGDLERRMRDTWARDVLPLHGEISTTRVCFVLPSSHAEQMLGAGFFYGMQPLPFLAELGFPITVLRTREPGLDGPEPPAPVPHELGLPEGAPLEILDQEPGESVVEAIVRSGARLVYSEWPADARAAAAGCVIFDARMLEPGLEGALRSARRLVALGRIPFFRRYGRYVGGGASCAAT